MQIHPHQHLYSFYKLDNNVIDAVHLIKEKYYHARDLLLVILLLSSNNIIIIVQLKNVHLLFYIRCSSNQLIVKKKQTMETLCLSITQYVMLRNKRHLLQIGQQWLMQKHFSCSVKHGASNGYSLMIIFKYVHRTKKLLSQHFATVNIFGKLNCWW